MTTRRRTDPTKDAAAFNAQFKVGDQVEYRSNPGAELTTHKVRTEAYVLSGHTAVVFLEGKSACVMCRACSAPKMTA